MLKKTLFIFVGILVFVLATDIYAQGGMKFKHADKNKDGTLDKKEIKMEKAWESKQKSKANTWWEKRADTNADGTVSSDELTAWKQLTKEKIDTDGDGVISSQERRLSWRHARSKVNKPSEAKYDANGDGWLQPEEVKNLLKDKSALVKTKGKAAVDTAVEQEYDANNDGVIDSAEADAMQQDIKK